MGSVKQEEVDSQKGKLLATFQVRAVIIWEVEAGRLPTNYHLLNIL
ncbi:hypothetical protein ACNQFZ_11895 [Schinkia sp. CFF1]